MALLRARPADGATGKPSWIGRRATDALVRAGLGLVGRLPPVRVPISKRLLRELLFTSDLLTDAGLVLPGTAFATYRKRRR